MSVPKTANISVILESRFDLLADVRTKLINNFPAHRVTFIQMTRGLIQNNVHAPVYCFAALPQGANLEGLPASATYGRAKPVEQVRARCMERNCPLRSPKYRLGLGPTPRDAGRGGVIGVPSIMLTRDSYRGEISSRRTYV